MNHKILYFTDLHLRNVSPKYRIDDIKETLVQKLAEIVEIVCENKIEAVLCGGDIFDHPLPSISIVTIFWNFLKELKIPFISICGNHDIFAHNSVTLDKAMMGLIREFAKEAKEQDITIFGFEGAKVLNFNDIKINIIGLSSHLDIDRINSFKVKEKHDFDILMIHNMLVNKPFFGEHVLIENFKTNVDLVLGSHYHFGFNPVFCNNTLFVNPGSMLRIKATQEDMKRIPQIALLEFEKNKDIKVKYIQLKSAKKGEEVFNLEILEEIKKQQINLQSFIDTLRTEEFEAVDNEELISAIAKQESLEERVKNEAIRRIKEAKQGI